MKQYSEAAVERMMKVREVILRALAKRITWWQAAEILGISDRSMRRWRERYQKHGYDGLFDQRLGKPSPKRVPVETVEKMLSSIPKFLSSDQVRQVPAECDRNLPPACEITPSCCCSPCWAPVP